MPARGYAFVGPQLTDAKYFGEGVGIAVRSGDSELAGKFNAAIDALRANGKYKQIQDKYFSFDVYGSNWTLSAEAAQTSATPRAVCATSFIEWTPLL